MVLLQAPNCPVHNQSSIITNSTRTRAGVLIECLDDVALPLIRETLLKNPPEFMLSPQGAHCLLCMLHSMLLAALAAATGHSIMQEMLLKNASDLVLLPQGKRCEQQQPPMKCLLQAAAAAASCMHAPQAAASRCETTGACLWRAVWTRPSCWGPAAPRPGEPS